jgi:two-component system, NtrC family, response regulator HydG
MSTSSRIFIVDDDRDLAESLAELLEARGYEVELAHTGEDGVARFRESRFDLVFMDVKLPGMNGVESFLELRKIKPDAKVVMMTGYSVEEWLTRAIENGALAILNKPFAVEQILGVVERLKKQSVILLADDDRDFAASVEPILGGAGYRVLLARDGAEAVRRVLEGGVDCLILDLKLPVLSGIDVYMQLKAAGMTVPTIIVTGHAGEESESLAALRSRAAGVLTKPFNPAHLLDAVAANFR